MQGLRYAARHTGLGPLLLYAAFSAMLLRGMQEILPPYVDRLFGRGAESLAVLTACFGVGALFAGLWVANRGGSRARRGWRSGRRWRRPLVSRWLRRHRLVPARHGRARR